MQQHPSAHSLPTLKLKLGPEFRLGNNNLQAVVDSAILTLQTSTQTLELELHLHDMQA